MADDELIAAARVSIEARFQCRQGLLMVKCQTGCRYVSIGREDLRHGKRAAIPGVRREGFSAVSYRTTCEAAEAFIEDFDAYAEYWKAQNPVAQPVLYWRYALPHIFFEESERKVNFRFRSRLVLSSQPVLWHSVEEHDAMHPKEPPNVELQRLEPLSPDEE